MGSVPSTTSAATRPPDRSPDPGAARTMTRPTGPVPGSSRGTRDPRPPKPTAPRGPVPVPSRGTRPPWPRNTLARWGLRLALSVPSLVLAGWVGGTGGRDGGTAALDRHAANIRWGAGDLAFVHEMYPPLPTGFAGLLP